MQVKFVAVGIWNTIFGYSVFLGLDTLGSTVFRRPYLAYMTAMVLSNVIAIINAFVLHKYVTFKSAADGRKILIEFFKFCTTYLLTFLLSIVLLPVLVELGNLPPKIAAGFVIIACTVISYLGHSRFSFRPLSERRGQEEN
jgi:putative flippase GtrA